MDIDNVKPGWAVVVKEQKTGCWMIFNDDTDPEDINREEDAHITPVVEKGEYLSFTHHDFNRNCCCGTRIEVSEFGQTLVIHREAN
jgi:hypothetical protein